jgi:hypothetical protein
MTGAGPSVCGVPCALWQRGFSGLCLVAAVTE